MGKIPDTRVSPVRYRTQHLDLRRPSPVGQLHEMTWQSRWAENDGPLTFRISWHRTEDHTAFNHRPVWTLPSALALRFELRPFRIVRAPGALAPCAQHVVPRVLQAAGDGAQPSQNWQSTPFILAARLALRFGLVPVIAHLRPFFFAGLRPRMRFGRLVTDWRPCRTPLKME